MVKALFHLCFQIMNQPIEQNNIYALDGLRGIASVAVILSHSFLMFIPGMHSGTDFSSHWQSVVFNSPLSFFYKGNAAVSIFFVLSGVVLSISCLRNNNISYIRAAALKRYVRLGIPVGASVLICYLMMCLSLFPAEKLNVLSLPLAIAFQFEPSYLSAIWDATFGAMIFSSVQYNYVLWTISLELFGSFLVYGFLAVFGGSLTVLRTMSFVGMVFLMTRENIFSIYYGLFLAGVFISTFKIRYNSSILSKLLAISSLIVGLYFLGYAPNSSSYSWIVNVFSEFQQAHDFKVQWPVFAVSVGAIFVVATIFIDYGVLRVLSKNIFRIVGKLSFSIYLLHPMILAVVGPVIYVYIAKYSYGAVYTFLITTTLTLVAAFPFYLYVDKVAMRCAKYIGEINNNEKLVRI